MYLSGEYDEDDMSYYEALFKRTMESDISAAASAARQQDGLKIVTEQEKEEARQAWLASKHDSINEQLVEAAEKQQTTRRTWPCFRARGILSTTANRHPLSSTTNRRLFFSFFSLFNSIT